MEKLLAVIEKHIPEKYLPKDKKDRKNLMWAILILAGLGLFLHLINWTKFFVIVVIAVAASVIVAKTVKDNIRFMTPFAAAMLAVVVLLSPIGGGYDLNELTKKMKSKEEKAMSDALQIKENAYCLVDKSMGVENGGFFVRGRFTETNDTITILFHSDKTIFKSFLYAPKEFAAARDTYEMSDIVEAMCDGIIDGILLRK